LSTFRFAINRNDLEKQFRLQFDAATAPLRRQMAMAMGREFFNIVHSNFGQNGVDRPKTWPALSAKYARRVGRGYATLYRRGRLKASGRLFVMGDKAVIEFGGPSAPYAEAHQFGTTHLSARPFFPIKGSFETVELTDYTKRRLEQAVQRILD